jgi:leader peptidase (prepilin peptidase)/N-methyltransferase
MSDDVEMHVVATGNGVAHAHALLLAGLYGALMVPALVSGELAASVLWASGLLGAVLVLLSVIDESRLRLPDVLTVPLLLAGLVLVWINGWDDPAMRAIAAVIGGSALAAVAWIYRRVRGQDGLGLGDAKLYAASGAWVGFEGLTSVLLTACLAALLFVSAAAVTGQKTYDRKSAIPFGPFLALGTWIVWLYGPLAW